MEDLVATLTSRLTGDVDATPVTRKAYARDMSIFERTPSLVVFPKNKNDVSELVKAVAEAKKRGEDASVTARSAGTDMSGGPLTSSIVAVFTKYMNKIGKIENAEATCEPGTYDRDLEKALVQKGYLLPSYPASRNIAAIGGLVNNNSGGERTLEYGKTDRYVKELEVVLSDGSITTLKELSPDELAEKKALTTFEGEIYRKMSDLIIRNRDVIEHARPAVSKNSAGYALWDVFDTENGTFDLTKLVVGAQGTLALTTSMTFKLVKPKSYRSMLVVFLTDLKELPDIVRSVLPHTPESFESYDDHTFSLAIRFLPQMLMQMGLVRAIRLGFSFLPEVMLALSGGVPKMVLMAEFAADTHEQALARAKAAQHDLQELKLPTRIAATESAAEKYWIVRRESFALLRKNTHGLYAAPFIDDFVVPPESYPQFLPELNELLSHYDLVYTIAGHIGNGNFHLIPLMDLSKPEVRNVILELSPKVYDLVLKYGGSTTGEHNDGIIRTPYLEQMFGAEVVKLFAETKHIFDPLNIFNPGKKVGGTFADIERDMLRHI